MDEEWKPVFGYEEHYHVSNLGRVRSLPRNGTPLKGRILKPVKEQDGYIIYCLMAQGVRKNHRAHRLVAMAFLPNLSGKKHINHIDNVRSNNHVTNLEWVTAQENSDHMVQQKRHLHGERHHKARLTIKQVREIRASGLRTFELAQKYSVGWSTIDHILKGDTWKLVK